MLYYGGGVVLWYCSCDLIEQCGRVTLGFGSGVVLRLLYACAVLAQCGGLALLCSYAGLTGVRVGGVGV